MIPFTLCSQHWQRGFWQMCLKTNCLSKIERSVTVAGSVYMSILCAYSIAHCDESCFTWAKTDNKNAIGKQINKTFKKSTIPLALAIISLRVNTKQLGSRAQLLCCLAWLMDVQHNCCWEEPQIYMSIYGYIIYLHYIIYRYITYLYYIISRYLKVSFKTMYNYAIKLNLSTHCCGCPSVRCWHNDSDDQQ